MRLVKSIDLWTEPNDNNDECFCGAFSDGFDNGNVPYDEYKIIRNCNCEIICSDSDLNITNKHHAIVFYKDGKPVRLLVINEGTDIDMCLEKALNQRVLDMPLREVLSRLNVKKNSIDLGREHIHNGADYSKEIDVGSCDRESLLSSMLEGSYTESPSELGKSNPDNDYHFEPNIIVSYNLMSDNECFFITHHCAFINKTKTRIIPLQDNSQLIIDDIRRQYQSDDSDNKKHL